MKYAWLVLLLIAGCSSGSAPDASITSGDHDAGIVGGRTITNASSPIPNATAFVMLLSGDQFESCTGVVVAKDLLLTAAHCFIPNAKPARIVPAWRKFVVFGSPLDLRKTAWHSRLQEVSQVAIHPAFNPLTNAHDIAVVLLTKPVLAAPMPIYKQTLAADSALTLAGYGRTQISGHDPVDDKFFSLLFMTTKLANQLDAQSPLSVPVVTSPTLTPAEGDSGGPAFVTLGGVRYVWGFDSYSSGSNPGEEFYTVLAGELPFLHSAALKLGSKESL